VKMTRKKNKRRLDATGKGVPELKHPGRRKRICKGWSNHGTLGSR